MDQETAYKVMMSLVNRAGLRTRMQKTIGGDWDVVMDQPGLPERILHTRQDAVAYWKRLKAEGKVSP
jgi:hypothetical protein